MDEKFDKLIEKLRKEEPSQFQMQKWKRAVAQADQVLKPKVQKESSYYWMQMVAAVFVGVLIGGVLFGQPELMDSEKNQEIAYEDATIEVVYTKL